MDFDFSDDQVALREAVQKWVEKAYDFERRKTIVAAGGFDRKAYGELAELGLTGLYVSEDDGGMGMGPVEGMVVMEALGGGIVLEPLVQALITGAVFGGYATSDIKADWSPRIAAGDAMVVLAYQERKARYRLSVCETRATATGSAWLLTGAKNLVPVADQADAYMVPAVADGRLALFLVERNTKGVSVTAHPTQDGGRAGNLLLDNAAATLITRDGEAALE
ncbi:MAG: acyl-CoA dehydrogenase family protein, partial [Hydrogenophaga sp.]